MGAPGGQPSEGGAEGSQPPTPPTSDAAGGGAMWGGRFEGGPDPLFRAVNDSLPVDWRLVEEDIAGSFAWSRAIEKAGILTADEGRRVREGLATVLEEARSLKAPPVESGAEDVHTWVEQRLTAVAGPLGKKLHTGRSRNDQVATDLRLWVRGAIDGRIAEVRAAQASLIALGERHETVILPGYTHLQRAQPVLAAHWALAYFEMLERDAERLADARARANWCPLGCGALAGTGFAIDREALAAELGFDGPCLNSLDAVADRDFVLETINASAACAIHLSKLAEELISFCSGEFGFVTLTDSMTSGSSLMPQKKNPDALELMRAKAGLLIGRQAGFAAVLKGLPLAYNKDLQEDKRAVFETLDELSLVLRVASRVLDGVSFVEDRCRSAAAQGYSNATDLADELVSLGVAFREAHEQVGRAVRAAIDRGVALEELGDAELVSICPALEGKLEAVRPRLTLEASVGRRVALGGSSPERVKEALSRAKEALGRAREESGSEA